MALAGLGQVSRRCGGVAVVFAALWLAAAGGGVGCTEPCSAATCTDGCCDGDGQCQPGASGLACGGVGGRCETCGSGQVCRARVCAAAPVVDAGLADGGQPCLCATGCCLSDGTCSPGNLPSSCGVALDFCRACAADQRCMAGVCVAAACGGCVDTVGACRVGTEVTACGSNAALCLACLPDELCLSRACTRPCNTTTCAGCCSAAGACVTSMSTQQCGTGGVLCAPCTATQQCLVGVCR